jgi:histidine triad (HIT) family protein
MSLAASYEPANIFAKIIRGEAPAIKVFEDEVAVAFMDIFPQSDGHTLVVPKTMGATNILTADPKDLAALITRVQQVTKALVKALKPAGVRIVQFNGAPAGQSVFHLHFHVIPIFEGAPLRRHGGEKAETAHLEHLAAKIRAAVS